MFWSTDRVEEKETEAGWGTPETGKWDQERTRRNKGAQERMPVRQALKCTTTRIFFRKKKKCIFLFKPKCSLHSPFGEMRECFEKGSHGVAKLNPNSDLLQDPQVLGLPARTTIPGPRFSLPRRPFLGLISAPGSPDCESSPRLWDVLWTT